ncbi:MAG: orotidine-5'-phosphate decarboxylase [Desulfovibrionaceae bacterium]|nr:orotidine-5'-phosphate decarboxylase [Desulfovibrionaceae bacterium]
MSKIVIALDYPSTEEALALAEKLRGRGLWMKVGMELFTLGGPEVVRALQNMGYEIFLDLKFHDIPNTVRGAVASAARLGAGLTTIHLSGGEEMCRAAVLGASAAPGLTVLGVTVLTSLSSEDLAADLALYGVDGAAPSPAALALNRAVAARNWGLRGIVCSPHEIETIKAACGSDFICLTPGIRLAGGATQDQKRVMTPGRAAALGSDFLVVGRAVTAAPDPEAACDLVLEDIAQAK